MRSRLLVFSLVVACGRTDLGMTDVLDATTDAAAPLDGHVTVADAPALLFDLSVAPTSLVLVQGGQAVKVLAHVTRLGGFTGQVDLDVTSLAAGVTATTALLPPGQTDATLALSASMATQQALSTTVVVRGTTVDAGTLTKPLSIFVRGCPGCLDDTFGTKGVSVVSGMLGSGIAIDSTGEILFPASVSPPTPTQPGLVVKLDASGAPDKTFGASGVAHVSGLQGHVLPLGIDISPLGSIAVCGVEATPAVFLAGANGGKTLVAQLTPTGQLDPSFAGTGMLAPNNDPLSSCSAVRFMPDGTLVVGEERSTAEAWVGHYSAVGTLDEAFGTNGWTLLPWGASPDPVLAIDPSGRVLAGGTHTGTLAIARLLPTGALDSTFGSGGWITASGGQGVLDFAVTPSTIVATGNGNTFGDAYFVTRLTSMGTPDTTFGAGGGVTVPTAYGPTPFGLAVQSTGAIVVAGSLQIQDIAAAFVHRLTPSGGDDKTFGKTSTVALSDPTTDDAWPSWRGTVLYPLDRLVVRLNAHKWKGSVESTVIVRLWL